MYMFARNAKKLNMICFNSAGNFDCLHGAELIEQAEFCHFRHESTSDCAAPFSNFFCNISSNAPVGVARLNFTYDQCLMLGGVPPEICTCKFKEGRLTCVPCGLESYNMHVHIYSLSGHTHPPTHTHTHTHTRTHAHTHRGGGPGMHL